ncbi:MAG: hypothetical protein QM760_14920 [Nibricoccus sp.]
MKKLLGVIGVLAVLVHGVAILGFGAADSSHSGDYTWRHQKVIDWLQAPILAVATLLFLLIAMERYREQARSSQRRWRVALGLAVANAVVWWVFVFPLQLRILSWNANWPPGDWSEVRKLHAIGCCTGTLLGVLTSAGLFWASRKDQRP